MASSAKGKAVWWQYGVIVAAVVIAGGFAITTFGQRPESPETALQNLETALARGDVETIARYGFSWEQSQMKEAGIDPKVFVKEFIVPRYSAGLKRERKQIVPGVTAIQATYSPKDGGDLIGLTMFQTDDGPRLSLFWSLYMQAVGPLPADTLPKTHTQDLASRRAASQIRLLGRDRERLTQVGLSKFPTMAPWNEMKSLQLQVESCAAILIAKKVPREWVDQLLEKNGFPKTTGKEVMIKGRDQ